MKRGDRVFVLRGRKSATGFPAVWRATVVKPNGAALLVEVEGGRTQWVNAKRVQQYWIDPEDGVTCTVDPIASRMWVDGVEITCVTEGQRSKLWWNDE